MYIKGLLSELTVEEKAALVSGTDFMYTNRIPRLNIPALRMSDGPHGLRVQTEGGDNGVTGSLPATAFPTAACTASGWNPENARKMGKAIARECHKYGVHIVLGPGANIKRNPTAGRNFEYFSEDPLLAGKMAAAEVTGIQSEGVGVSVKHFALNNSENYYTDKIERAIEGSKKVSFRYFSLNYKGEKVFRREGRRYIVNPVVLVCDNDNYYLVCYDDKHEGTANYRLDRMDELAEEDTPITEREKSWNFNQHIYRRQSFSMYAGEPTDVYLIVEEPLVEEMFDKFGMNIKLIPLGDGKYRLAVCVQVSLAFFRWVAGSLGKIRIRRPYAGFGRICPIY